MKKMKYFIVIILGIALLTGCASDSGQSVQNASQTETENKSIKEEIVMQTREEKTTIIPDLRKLVLLVQHSLAATVK